MKQIIKTLSVRVKDKHAKQLRQWAFECNQVWNAANSLSSEFGALRIAGIGWVNVKDDRFRLKKSSQ